MGNRVGKIGAVKTSGLTRLPNDGGGCRRTLGSSSLRKIRGALLSRGVRRECNWTLRNTGTAARNRKFILALGDVFADMAVIPTGGSYGMSLL